MNTHRIFDLISPYFRRQRIRSFLSTLGVTPTHRILDVGGTAAIWQHAPFRPAVTLCNTDGNHAPDAKLHHLPLAVASALSLPFPDQSFDIVFSNSTIEHVGSWHQQQEFAREALRVGRAIWIQTPAREFFFEPHLLTPFVHWLPLSWQRRSLRWLALRSWLDGWKQAEVDAHLAEIRLLSAAEMQNLFPDCEIRRETWLGRTKSYIAIRRAKSA